MQAIHNLLYTRQMFLKVFPDSTAASNASGMYSKGDSGKNGKYNFNGADVQNEMRAGDLHLGSSACSSDHGSSLDQESPLPAILNASNPWSRHTK